MAEILVFIIVFAIFTVLFTIVVYNYNSRNEEELMNTEDRLPKEKYEDMDNLEKILKQNRLIMKELKQLRYDIYRIKRSNSIKIFILFLVILLMGVFLFLYQSPEIRSHMVLEKYL